jgi:hypothetical protein
MASPIRTRLTLARGDLVKTTRQVEAFLRKPDPKIRGAVVTATMMA